jgi:hypothetical protein
VATDALSELHVIERPVSTPPLASSVVAVACAIRTAVIEAGTKATVTDATGAAVTVIEDVPLTPSLIAVMVALPTANALTRPVAETLAIDGALEVQVVVLSVSVLLLASVSVAMSCSALPATTLTDPGLTLTAATGAAVTFSIAVPVCPSLVALI